MFNSDSDYDYNYNYDAYYLKSCLLNMTELKRERDSWKLEAESREKECKQMKEELDALRAATNKDVWYYQGDGFDFPESVACHVVMSAQQFKTLIDLAWS